MVDHAGDRVPAAGDEVVLTGTVGCWESRRRRTGELFVKADLALEDGSTVRCVWWEARRAPRPGTRVQVRGEVRTYDGVIEVHVRETRPVVEQVPAEFEHRLLRYYIACLEAEQMRQVEFDPADDGRSFVLLTSGEPGLFTGEAVRVELPRDPRVVQWCRRRSMSGPAEQSFIGYPVVVGERERDGRPLRVIGPLFFLPLSVRRRGQGYEAVLDGSVPELNAYALDLLGLGREEREGLVRAVEESEALEEADSPRERIRAWLDVLATEGLVDQARLVGSEELEPLREDLGVSKTAILYAAERAAVIRQLVQDLEELAETEVESLRRGPLGILLGARPCPEAVPARPQPCVLPTNLAQDEAISNALERPFTVVTGPPGTGKSQVLVNAVAAALARGESVLFASKNNQAVDVVFRRLADVSARAMPVRAGASSHRGEVALRIQEALARRRERLSLASALEGWRQLEGDLVPLYEQASRRMTLERELQHRDADYAEALRRLPPGADAIEAPGTILSHAEEVRALWPVTLRKPGLLPWRRARWRVAVRRVGELWPALRAATASVLELPAQPDPSAIDRVAELMREVVHVAALKRAVDEVQEQLDRLPERWELDDRLASVRDRRTGVSRALFEAAWATRLADASPQARSAATRFAEGFARLGRGERESLRRLLELVPDVLSLFPVWGVTNLSARGNFPLHPGLFDLVIIDEASQCDIPSAIPLLYRAKRALIIGDPNQLTHVTSLRGPAGDALAKRWRLGDREMTDFSYSRMSLYGLAAAREGEDPLFLDQHFRSRLAIIAFSNDHFYGERLSILTEEPPVSCGPAVQWVHVPGRFGRGPRGRSVVNAPEVAAVAEELRRLSQEMDLASASVGVVTPFRAHAEAIQERVARDLSELTEVLTVASAHRFQGDERDVIVFSPTVCEGMPDYLWSFASDPNLVNVAITRARQRLVVVGDRYACLSRESVLKELARYIEGLESHGFRSPCELELYEALVASGIPVRAGYEVDGRRLDLAVVRGPLKLDIEVDGAAYHRDARADAVRDRQLQEAGWQVLRFSAREVRRDVDACVARVRAVLDLAGDGCVLAEGA